jgi:tape measure domain-containing protein
MADPKIKYDIEAAVKGEADAEALAKTLRGVGDVLEGDLQKSAQGAAQALEALGSKQRALESFRALSNETGSLAIELAEAQSALRQVDAQLTQASAATQKFSQAELAAKAALESNRADLTAAKKAYEDLQASTVGAARRTEEYRQASQTARANIQQLSAEIKQHARSLKEAEGNTRTAQQAENALSAQHQQTSAALIQARGALDGNNAALDAGREKLRSMGIEATNLAQAERNLQGAVTQVRQEVAAMAPAYQQAAAASSQSTQVQAQNQRTLREGMTSISTQLQRIQQIATVALGGSYVGGLAKSVADTADQFKNLEARIKLATGEGPQFQAAFDGVAQVALRTNSALDETGTLFARLVKAGQEAGQSAQLAQQNALGLTETINQAIQLSGGSADASKAAITQLIQGLQSGVLRGEEFNSVMEQAPRLAQALANGLGVTTGELRKMANQGALTADVVMNALKGQADVVAGEFSKLPPTVGRALQNLTSQWTLYVGASDNGLISSANAAKVIDSLAANIDTLVATLTTAGKLWAAMKVAGLAADFGAWALKTLSATAAVEKNTIAVAANTAAQAANAAAQTANNAATTASTAARTANASAWSSVATFMGQATAAQSAATAATKAGAQAVTAKTGVLGMLGKGIGGVTRLLGGPVGLVVNLVLFREELKRGKDAALDWAFSFTEAGKQLKAAEKALKDQEDAAKRNAEAAKAAAEAARLLAQRQEEARNSSFDLTKQSKGLIAEFGKLTKEGESSGAAIAKIGKDFDPSTTQGIRDMSGALEKLAADGKISADQVKQAWVAALDGQDLAKFEVLARNAFAAAGQEAEKLSEQIRQAIDSGASPAVVGELQKRLEAAMSAADREGERVAQMMDTVLNAAVARTGLEFSALEGRIGATSRSAINDLDVIIGGLDRLKAQGLDAGRALEASFVKALDTADSQRAVDEVTSRVESLRRQLGDKVADGLLDQAKQKTQELNEALDKAKPGINSLAEAMKQLGITSDASLKDTAAQARVSYDAIAQSGKASAREMADAFKVAAEAAIKANGGIAPSWVTAQASARGYKIEVDDAGRTTLEAMKRAQDSLGGVEGAHRSAAGAARDQANAVQSLASAYTDAGAKAMAAQGQILEAAQRQKNADTSASSITNRKSSETMFVWTRSSIIDYLKQAGLEDAVAEQLSKQFLNGKGEVDYIANDAQKRWAGKYGTLAEALGKVAEFYKYDEGGQIEALDIVDRAKRDKELRDRQRNPKAPAPAPAPTTPGGNGGSGGDRVDRVVNVYIGNSTPYSVPTNEGGQRNIEAIAREVLRLLELQRNQLGY